MSRRTTDAAHPAHLSLAPRVYEIIVSTFDAEHYLEHVYDRNIGSVMRCREVEP